MREHSVNRWRIECPGHVTQRARLQATLFELAIPNETSSLLFWCIGAPQRAAHRTTACDAVARLLTSHRTHRMLILTATLARSSAAHVESINIAQMRSPHSMQKLSCSPPLSSFPSWFCSLSALCAPSPTAVVLGPRIQTAVFQEISRSFPAGFCSGFPRKSRF